MDGIHDLGGKQGFGTVKQQRDFVPFETSWEARMWALSFFVGSPDLTTDRFRHLIELLDPVDYLTHNYFDKWYFSIVTDMVASGILSDEELKSGRASVSAPPPASLSLSEVLETACGYSRSSKREIDHAPIYYVGQIVRTQKYGISGHTRLPAYARNRQGDVIAYHGSHVLPDTNVNNVEAPQHLYTVRFAAQELWGPDAAQNDFINIDAWESYLVRA